MMHRRTPCTERADDRARRLTHHRTPCTESASSRADKRCTPCTATDTLPRARTAPLCKGPSSASSPCSTRAPSPQPRRPHLGAPHSRSTAKSDHSRRMVSFPTTSPSSSWRGSVETLRARGSVAMDALERQQMNQLLTFGTRSDEGNGPKSLARAYAPASSGEHVG